MAARKTKKTKKSARSKKKKPTRKKRLHVRNVSRLKGAERRPKGVSQIGRAPGLTDEDPWPEPEDCGSIFDQEGTATRAVEDCQNVNPNVYLRLTKDAKDDAQAKANFRCPNRCPAVLQTWKSSTPTCTNGVAQVTMVGTFKCVEK